MAQRYHIATATEDSVYYVPVYIMLFSLFENNKDILFKVHILYRCLSEEEIQALEQLAISYNHEINWVSMATAGIDDYYIPAYLTVATYYRVYAPYLLQNETEKLLFLDADIIVDGSIKQLLEEPFDCTALMAVKEVVPHKTERLGIPDEYDYFNAGVIVFNTAAWRNNKYHELLIQNIDRRKSEYLMFDQDALNELFYTNVKFIAPRWNHQTGFYHVSKERLAQRYNMNADQILNEPIIIHYTTNNKPWTYACTHPFKPLFLQYLNRTAYKHFAENGSIKKWIGKNLLRISHKIQKLTR